MTLSPRATGLLAAFVTVGAWTAFIVGSRAVVTQRTLAPLDLAVVRVAFAAAVLLPWGWWLCRGRSGTWLKVSPLPARTSAILGLLAGLWFPLAAYHAFLFAPAAHGSVLMPGLLPLWTAALSVLVLRERLGLQRALGLSLVLAGAVAVASHSLGQAGAGLQAWKGDLLFMSASFAWAIFTILCRRWQISAVHSNIAVLTFASVTLLPTYALLVAAGAVSSGLAQASWREILAQGVLQGWIAVVVSGIGFMKMVESFGPVRTTMITAVVPGLSALCAMTLLGEPLSRVVAAGLACVTVGIFVGVRGAASR
ncbi:MAG: DMT family transporter [Betaproteobacteria bacterium]|jgi:drug/metabolite transporter (DMT)-like permease